MFVLPILAAAIAAATPLSPTDPDVRCTGLLAFKVGQTHGEDQAKLMTGLFYFIGKLKARDAAADLETLLRGTYHTDPNLVANNAERCGAELQHLGAEMQVVGAALTAHP